MQKKFHYWQGQSGSWWIHSVLTIEEAFNFPGPANYCLVRRDLDKDAHHCIEGKQTIYLGVLVSTSMAA